MTAMGDKLKFFIRCRRVSPTDNCFMYCQSCQQKDASGLNKLKMQAMWIFALSFKSILLLLFSSLKCFSFDWLWCYPPSKMLNFCLAENFQLQIHLWYHQIKTVEMQSSIIINVFSLISLRYAIRTNIKTISLRSFHGIQDPGFTTKM